MTCWQKLLFIHFSLLASTVQADLSLPMFEDKTPYQTQVVWPDIIIPWGMVQLPNEQILATERSGKLWLLSEGKPSIEIVGLPEIDSNGQGGLLDIALHPKFENNQVVFFTYASQYINNNKTASNTALMRAKLDLNNHRLVEQKQLYLGEGDSNKGQHYGSRIAVTDQFVYFSIGDRGQRDKNPQNLSLDGGKIYRLNLDGSIPTSNPFYQQANAKKAIYSYGHRNPQGLVTLADNTQLWSHEHGPRGGDEVNLIEAGKNYGWPVIGYGTNYIGTNYTDITEKQGMEQPKLYWDPSIAPSGMAYISSEQYPQWQGKVLLGGMKYGHLVLLEINNKHVMKQTKLLAGIGRVRNVMQGNDGYIYLGIDGKGILRLLPEES
ncbi:PQQ-dependent sugar dehydrogenase [Psychromonas sp. 14N.309.X.WAT.B.A12]|uniref:PQQ-dependent sugar dehydrogenase n=1 Tax=unclassified Psychromonas TaxID=2614957 RepID=UPI0025B0548A|nr:PQQ-dependent sugar dehydrogenase [Psychromonas sp. 14N.309.X.WAT.B.A12]MDN2663712.1 PQQ-dependent sugar dehydrogenase [Psychromonas sp. 14N.309.X.WAT.B.A12]